MVRARSMNSETESSTAKNNNDDGSLYVPYKNKLKSAVVLICLLMVSIGILSRDRAFFEEFLEHPQTVVEETATGKGSGIASCSNSSQNAIDTRSSASFFSSMNKTDWFHDDLWSTKNHCFEVDHVCFSTARWWYNTNVPGKQDLRQPNFTYTAHSDHASTRAKLALPKQIEVRPATKLVENMTCPYSPFPNHLLLTSVFNDMLGEFYARMLVGLIYTLDKAENLDVLLESTQVYIQVYNYNKKMMDSHHAFMTPFLTHRLHDARELLQSTTCSCVERMIFCGFKKETTGSNIVIRGGDGFDYRIFKGIVQDDARVQNLARIRLRERTILGNPFVQEDIANFRRAFLQGKGIKDSYDEWKIVGLAQRSGRRRWLNIEETMTMCNKMLNSRIVCMIVNVEEAHFHPTMHVIVHASLDALIGIHGAQMTDAIWMRPGTFVGEFLPYLPQGVRYGDWTQEVRKFTPLGVIYHGTDLQHVGIPLKYDSVPDTLCPGLTGDAFRECVREFKWDSRDFVVNPKYVEDTITNFVHKRPTSCADQKNVSGSTKFVLYNVHCEEGGKMGLHHFYWDKPLAQLDEFSGVPPDK